MPTPGLLFLGAMTGTSVDGLDLALLEVADELHIRAGRTVPFPTGFRERLLRLGQPGQDDVDEIGRADAELGEFIGAAALEFLQVAGISANAVTAIGSHGQTIRHRPDGEHPFSWQIGDPNRIAEVSGITTIADFRRRDLAAGGQGAPLVPAFHEALLRTPEEPRVVLNIGGISNVTYLPAEPSQPVSGFDTGPGNCLLDAWCARHLGRMFDADGEWAATGRPDPQLLAELLADPYFSRPPPKSTGREYFNLDWLAQHLPGRPRAEDVQRTLLELTTVAILKGISDWADTHAHLIVCGGGRHNRALLQRLSDLAQGPVSVSESLGVDGDALEAAAFAWLAARRLAGEPGNVPSVTGARGPRVLGAIYPGT